MRRKRFSAKISPLAITAPTPGCNVMVRGRSSPVRLCAIMKIPRSVRPIQKNLQTLLVPTSWHPDKPESSLPRSKSCTSKEKANASSSCRRLPISFSVKAWRAAFFFATPITEKSTRSSIAETTKTSSGAKPSNAHADTPLTRSRLGHRRRKREVLKESEGRLRFRKRPSYLDGGKPNSVSVITHADDHLSHSATRTSSETPSEFSFAVMLRYPRIKRTGCPACVLSCTAWCFSCVSHYSTS